MAASPRGTALETGTLVLVSGAVLLSLGLAGSGCNLKKAETKSPPALSKSQKGHAYLAMLMPAHPLYGELQSLQESVAALRGAPRLGVADGLEEPWVSPVLLAGPLFTEYPTRRLHERRGGWQHGLSTLELAPVGQLPRDLEARLAWRQQEIRRQTMEQLQLATGAESRRLAELRINRAKHYQTERANIGLDLDVTDTDIEEHVARRRRELDQQIQQELAEAAKAGQGRLRRLSEQLRQQEQQMGAEAHAELLGRAEQRQSDLEQSVAELHQQLQQQVAAVGEPQWRASSPDQKPQPAAQPLSPEMRGQAFAQYRALCETQAARLVARKAALTAAIAQATALAARRVAWAENIDLHLRPEQSPQGSDVTELIRRKLSTMWTGHQPLTARRDR